jgi:hypothetical protein
MATRKTNKNRGRKTRTMNRLKQAQRAALRAASAARKAQFGLTATSAKQAQYAMLHRESVARGALAGRTSASSKQAQKAALRMGGSLQI